MANKATAANGSNSWIAFGAMLTGELDKRFPATGIAIVAAGSTWLPFVSVMAMRAREDITNDIKERILGANPRARYAL